MSARLAQFSAYYSNRMSYDEVAGLLEPERRDTGFDHIVVTILLLDSLFQAGYGY